METFSIEKTPTLQILHNLGNPGNGMKKEWGYFADPL